MGVMVKNKVARFFMDHGVYTYRPWEWHIKETYWYMVGRDVIKNRPLSTEKHANKYTSGRIT